MTLTTQEDPILSPFKLEHDIQVSKHQFTLRPDLYEALRVNPDLQLELYVEEDLLQWSAYFLFTAQSEFSKENNLGVSINKEKTIWKGTHCFDDFCFQEMFRIGWHGPTDHQLAR